MEKADSYAIFKRDRGWLAATIKNVKFVKSLCQSDVRGDSRKHAVCIIDLLTNKCYKSNMESIYHLGKAYKYFRTSDIDIKEEKAQNKIRIFGGCAPACFPSKLNEFYNERPDNKIKAKGKEIVESKQNIMLRKYILQYILKKGIKDEKTKKTRYLYENIMHLVCREDNIFALQEF